MKTIGSLIVGALLFLGGCDLSAHSLNSATAVQLSSAASMDGVLRGILSVVDDSDPVGFVRKP